MSDWQFVKHRTAADGGAVWRSADGALFKRTGGTDVREEADLLQRLTQLGYPVPELVDRGVTKDGGSFFTERSVGEASLHDQALADTREHGHVLDATVEAAVAVSVRLLEAQARHARPATEAELRAWFERAAFAANVREENPDLDTDRVRRLVDRALERLRDVPLCLSHLDYGLPNAFPGGIIDWQHHAPAPLGYDVYPMLELVPFKGGNRGYQFTSEQRARYTAGLDDAATALLGRRLSEHMGEFLLAKCFFFLALMRPTDPAARPDKHAKWQYRRALFIQGLEQYESTNTVDTAAFPTLAAFTASLTSAARP